MDSPMEGGCREGCSKHCTECPYLETWTSVMLNSVLENIENKYLLSFS